MAYASTVPYHGSALPGVDVMRRPRRPNAIVMTVTIAQGLKTPSGSPKITPPYQLSEATVLHGYEGQPDPNVPFYQINTDVPNEYTVTVSVWFGRQTPSRKVLARAQAMPDTLKLPAWPA